ncbi:hypothetical protein P775_09740 [Puniceibacterium antarcticum]|uniref:HTH cro/C1-type domain-containing protein n=1 Tax=Puniceibacterium antarcticum TaxID=1206336 RepID=A0A2G8RG83_9RHOB|nr:hypothetical protein [Puniceibacterium antarcticum]PIL20411.1 hypothetical protein P775_09740 [Puniceibacterium antarcticum]
MTHDELEKLFRHGDTSNEALRVRLIAARRAVNLEQKEVADATGVAKQTYHSQEARGAPSIKTGRYFYRAHRIDFNYLLYGDFAQLPNDVVESLTQALASQNA